MYAIQQQVVHHSVTWWFCRAHSTHDTESPGALVEKFFELNHEKCASQCTRQHDIAVKQVGADELFVAIGTAESHGVVRDGAYFFVEYGE